jgi:glucose-6-phosphate 1-dehydrogenase
MIDRLAVLGATGDLTGRYLLPALAALCASGKLPDAFRLAAVGREDWDDEAFRNWAAAQLERHGSALQDAAKRMVVAEMTLELDNWRWAGTRFRMRTGKALGRDRKEVAVHFRPVPHFPFDHDGPARPNVLRFGLEPESVEFELIGTGSRPDTLAPLTLTSHLEPPALPPYGELLLDVLTANTALSIRADEAEESWRVVTPVLDAWAKDLVPLEEYTAGSKMGSDPIS